MTKSSKPRNRMNKQELHENAVMNIWELRRKLGFDLQLRRLEMEAERLAADLRGESRK